MSNIKYDKNVTQCTTVCKIQIGEITQSTLTKQLRELESDGFISRYIYQEIPPKVEYSLTELGKSFVPILEHMKAWGDVNLL